MINAINTVPTFPYLYNENLHRIDCVKSGKGGKRPGGFYEHYDLNPCFCHASALCIEKANGKIKIMLITIFLFIYLFLNYLGQIYNLGECPKDGKYDCIHPITPNIGSPYNITVIFIYY